MMQHTLLFLVAVFLLLCGTSCSTASPPVQQFGAMREVMRDGRTEPRVDLGEVTKRSGALAVGALEGLAGEVTILNGDTWIARVNGGDLHITGPKSIAGDRATLLTLAYVDEWQSQTITDAVDAGALEAVIEHAARAGGLDVTQPFPLVLEGIVDVLDLHVINGYCPIAVDPATIDAQPWRLARDEPIEAVIVGFYAANATGVMTHHGTAIHLHAILEVDGKVVTGHVDQVAIAAEATLRLPAAGWAGGE